ncbi:MAG: hypothetical protein KKB20_10165 [Proteobacteria bacterium]|nr:hypothetical protein [Pseudomonadota bacterium]
MFKKLLISIFAILLFAALSAPAYAAWVTACIQSVGSQGTTYRAQVNGVFYTLSASNPNGELAIALTCITMNKKALMAINGSEITWIYTTNTDCN